MCVCTPLVFYPLCMGYILVAMASVIFSIIEHNTLTSIGICATINIVYCIMLNSLLACMHAHSHLASNTIIIEIRPADWLMQMLHICIGNLPLCISYSELPYFIRQSFGPEIYHTPIIRGKRPQLCFQKSIASSSVSS